MKKLIVIGLVVAAAVYAVIQTLSEPTSEDWMVVGGLDDSRVEKFILVWPKNARNRAVYDDAATRLCKEQSLENVCILTFFLPGDRIPETQPRSRFYGSGGWSGYTPVAKYWQNRATGVADFTVWDCERAGEEDAPLDALCGVGVREGYNAVLTLGIRTGRAEFCGWQKTGDESATRAYIAGISHEGRRAQFLSGFEMMLENGRKGPDVPADCDRMKDKIDANAAQARKTLGF